MPFLALAGLFFLVAIAYASVGFGGGSSYNALLILSGVDFRLVPAIALSCNILVVVGGVYHAVRAGHLVAGQLIPFILLSIPMAWFGGTIPVSEQLFIGLLGFSLLVAAVQMLFKQGNMEAVREVGTTRFWTISALSGGLIGLVSGITGIGGGIFLAPLIYALRLVPPKTIAGITSGFILVNSIAGLAGQMMKKGEYSPLAGWIDAWPLFIVVVVGGQIGTRLGIYKLSENWVKRLTAVLIMYVAVRLIWRWAGMLLG